MTPSRFRVPHTLVLLFGMIVIAQILTYILPPGSYERVTNVHGREQVVPDTFHKIDQPKRLPLLTAFTAVPKGFAAAEEIIFFVFIIGGAFGVFRATGAADALIGFLLDRFGSMPALLVAGGTFVFTLGSATIGMAEEYLPFIPVLLALCVGLGFDAVTAVGILCIGYAVGYGGALINPFTVFIAQDIAGIEQGSGILYRLVLMLVFWVIGFDHVWRYARKVRKDPSKSLVADIEPDPHLVRREAVPLNRSHVAALVVIVGTLGWLVYGLKVRDWYLVEMGALFLGLAVVLGIIGRLGMDRCAAEFCKGASELTTTALLIGFARSIQVVLTEGQVVDTIIHGVAQPLKGLGAGAAAVGMFALQTVCNFFIPSGSGQAYVTMPVMAPLADLVGVTRQVAVLAYQFGDGFTNILVPTSAVLVGILAMARVPFDRWLRFVVPFLVKVSFAAAIALVLAVWFGYR